MRCSMVPSVTSRWTWTGTGLADPVGAVGGLVLDRGVPPAVEVDDVVGAGQVEAGAARLEREQEDRARRRPGSRGTICSRARTGVPPWRNSVGIEAAAKWRSSRRAMATYWVKTSTEPFSARIVPSSSSQRSSFSERPRSRPPGLAQVVGRVVADLLEPGQQRQHQAAAGGLVGALDAVHRLAHQRLVEDHLLAGQPDHVVGLGLGRQLGRDAGVGLAAPQQERLDELGEPAGDGRVDTALDRRGPDLAEGGAGPEQPRGGPVEDRPQLGQVVLDGGAGQRHPAPRLDGAEVAGGRGRGVLDVLRLVGDDQVPRDGRQGPASDWCRAASCRRWSARTRHRGSCRASEREVPWKRRTATPGANRRISVSQLPIRLAGHTTSVGPVAERALRAGAGAARSG